MCATRRGCASWCAVLGALDGRAVLDARALSSLAPLELSGVNISKMQAAAQS
tara:strand:- start:296 stop:451 length:156 start_codon:yes stop_codon:yes gene_type:complete